MPGFVFLDFSPNDKTAKMPDALNTKATYKNNNGIYFDCSWLLHAERALGREMIPDNNINFNKIQVIEYYEKMTMKIKSECLSCTEIYIFVHGDIGHTSFVSQNFNDYKFEIPVSLLVDFLKKILSQNVEYRFYFIICYGARTIRYFVDHDSEINQLSNDELMKSVVGRLLKGIYQATQCKITAIATTSSTAVATSHSNTYDYWHEQKKVWDTFDNPKGPNKKTSMFKKEPPSTVNKGDIYGFWERFTLSQCTLTNMGIDILKPRAEPGHEDFYKDKKFINNALAEDAKALNALKKPDTDPSGTGAFGWDQQPNVPTLKEVDWYKKALKASGRRNSVGAETLGNLKKQQQQKLSWGQDYESGLLHSAHRHSSHFVELDGKHVKWAQDLILDDFGLESISKMNELTNKHNCLLYICTKTLVAIYRLRDSAKEAIPENMIEVRSIPVNW